MIITEEEPGTRPARGRIADAVRSAGAAWRRWHRDVWTVHLAEHEAFDCCEWRSLDDFLDTAETPADRPLEVSPVGA